MVCAHRYRRRRRRGCRRRSHPEICLCSYPCRQDICCQPILEAPGVYWQNTCDSIAGGLSFGLIVNFWREGSWHPYISGSIGGFILPNNRMGSHDLGCNFRFRTKGSLGISLGQERRHGVQVDVAHFSNAGLGSSNSGFNVFGVSYGFRFQTTGEHSRSTSDPVLKARDCTADTNQHTDSGQCWQTSPRRRIYQYAKIR